MVKEKEFYKKWEVWISFFALIISILSLANQYFSDQAQNDKIEGLFSNWKEYTESHMPTEEIKVEYPGYKYSKLSETFNATIPFTYSGQKTTTYFIDWSAINSEGNSDYIQSLGNSQINSINTIKEKDGTKIAVKKYEFSRADTYTITANIFYSSQPNEILGKTEEEVKTSLKNKNISKNVPVSFQVKINN